MRILRRDLYSSYKGLKIMANPDLHPAAAKEIRRIKLDKNAKILILAAGTGAFDRRLLDMGFKNITSLDIDKGNYKVEDSHVNFISANLNSNFSALLKDKFDLIVCLEIIEHVYSPFHFISGCEKLLKDDGRIILSSPNIHDYFSRVHFLLFGYPSIFLNPPEKYGHVSPVFKNILEHYLYLNNLKIFNQVAVSNIFKYLQIYTFKSYLYYSMLFISSCLLFPFYLISREKNNGLISIYSIKRNA